MTFLSLHTGLRAGEIFNLRWKDVNLNSDFLIIKDAKGNKNRNMGKKSRSKNTGLADRETN